MDDSVPLQIDYSWKRSKATVPRHIAEAAYVEYAVQYGTDQSFDRLHERGGFEAVELMQLLVEYIQRLKRG